MKKNKWKQIVCSLMLVVLLMLTGNVPVHAENNTRMALTFDRKNYDAGSIVTAQIYIYDAEFNAAGFSLKYNTQRMVPVLADGTDSDNANQLITIHNQYDDDEGTGTFSVLSRDINKESGNVEVLLYINPNAGKTATADSSGMRIGEIAFRMLESGTPDIKFAVNEDSVDFYAVPCLILNEGAQMETAYAHVQVGEETIQNVDISKEVIDQKDTELENQKKAEESDHTGNSATKNENKNAADGSSDETQDSNKKTAENNTEEKSNVEENGQSYETWETGDNAKNEKTDESRKTSSVKDNDSQSGQQSTVYMVAIVLVILIAAGFVIIFLKKRNKEEKNEKTSK